MALDIALNGTAAGIEDRLAVRCRSGDAGAFDELVTRYQLRLYRFAYRLLQDRSEAEDAVQETFLRAYRALSTYRPDGYFSSWIYRITLNECRRRLRGRRHNLPLEFSLISDSLPDPQTTIIANERNRELRMALEGLPEHYRIVMALFYFEEMSIEEISRTLNVSISAIKVRLHRGRERLANRLGSPL